MNKKIAALFLITGFIAFSSFSCSKQSSGEAINEEEIIPVETITVKTQEINESLELLGDIRSNQEVRLFSKIPDRITRFAADMGDYVDKGDLIAAIENSSLQAGVNQTQANLEQAQSQLENLKNEFKRMEQLLQENAISQQQYDGVKTQLEATRAQVRGLQEALNQSNNQLSESYIRSPITGVIGKRFLEEGDMASMQSPIVTVVQMDTVKVAVNIVEKHLAGVREGLKTLVEVNAYPGERFEGVVTKVSPVIDPMSRMAEVEILLPNTDLKLRPGMFAEVSILLTNKENAIVIPKYAVLQRTELIRDELGQQRIMKYNHVYTVEKDRAYYREIEMGIENEGIVEVASGLMEGEQVVLLGQNNLEDSTKVRLMNQRDNI